MNSESVYVIFFCDECELLAPVTRIFHQLHPEVRVHVTSDVEDLIQQTKLSIPKLILVYFSKPDKNYISFVKFIRENVKGSNIPIHIYRVLPEEKELTDIFKKVI